MPEIGEGRKKNQRNMYLIGDYKRKLLNILKLNKDFQVAMLGKDETDNVYDSFRNSKNGAYKIEKFYKTEAFEDCVFDFAFTPGTTTDEHIFVCCEVYCPRTDRGTYKTLNISFYVFTPKMMVKWKTPKEKNTENELINNGYVGNKIDMVIDIIDRAINGTEHVALGKIELDSNNGLQIFNYVDGYYGKQLNYKAVDFDTLPPSALQNNYRDGEVDE